MENTQDLQDRAAAFLEENHISGDTMIQMNHGLDNLGKDKIGAYYLHELMVAFLEQMDYSRYYYLKEGDIIKEGDEVEMSEGLNAPVKWVKTNCVGQKAPSPLFISHRKYRRLISSNFG